MLRPPVLTLFLVSQLFLVLPPVANAQSQSGIACGPPAFPAGSTCTDTAYGLGSALGGIRLSFDEYAADPDSSQFVTRPQLSPFAPDCGGESPRVFDVDAIPGRGTLVLRELEDAGSANGLCDPVSSGSCPVVVPYDSERLPFPGCDPVLGDPTAQVCDETSLGTSAIALASQESLFGGAVEILAANEMSLEGSWGRRIIDPTGPGTRVNWDPDGAGPEPNEIEFVLRGCLCCDALGPHCAIPFAFQNYPLLNCPQPFGLQSRRATSDLIFDAAAGVGPWGSFEHEITELPGDVQQYGVCEVDRTLGCDRTAPAAPGTAHCSLNPAQECSGDADCAAADGFCRSDATGFPAGPTDCPDLAGGVPQACDYREWGIRQAPHRVLPDGSPNPNACQGAQWHLKGRPASGCTIVDRFAVDGDPGPGCRIPNFGTQTFPDDDCDGVPDSPDLCPALGEFGVTTDTNQDGIGDECQCGDANLDGAITSLDIAAMTLCAHGVTPCDPTIADADGDGSVTSLDIGGVVNVMNSTNPPALECPRNFTHH